jgi:hypothetical protein
VRRTNIDQQRIVASYVNVRSTVLDDFVATGAERSRVSQLFNLNDADNRKEITTQSNF